MANGVIRTAAIGATCAVAGSLAFGFHAQNSATAAAKDASAWQAEATRWQDVAQQAVADGKQVRRRNRQVVKAYNGLVKDTRATNRKLLAAVRKASTTRTVTLPPETVYRTISAPTASADPAPAPDPGPVAQPQSSSS